MSNDSLNKLITNWGGIRCVSPSGEYYLCIRSAADINGFEVALIESESYKEMLRIRIASYSPSNHLFSGIAWNREETKLLYDLFI